MKSTFKPQWAILISTVILSLFGIVMIYSASSYSAKLHYRVRRGACRDDIRLCDEAGMAQKIPLDNLHSVRSAARDRLYSGGGKRELRRDQVD